jgi:hypothetical protein
MPTRAPAACPRRSVRVALSDPTIPRPAARVQPQRSQHRPSPYAAPLPWVRSKLACETGLKEGIHILRASHKDGLLVVIGKDEEALLLYRLDDALSHLVGCHQHAMKNG